MATGAPKSAGFLLPAAGLALGVTASWFRNALDCCGAGATIRFLDGDKLAAFGIAADVESLTIDQRCVLCGCGSPRRKLDSRARILL